MKWNKFFHTLLIVFVCGSILHAQPLPRPTSAQIAWQKRETTAFLHFSVNTFTGKEWGDGTESPSIFNPVDFDADRIVQTLKENGFKMAIITAKHHDGFCLWQTKTTEHCIRNSPYKNGKGDIVKELADACRKNGIRLGVYLSPWDRHEPSYGTAAYNDFYKAQLRELLTNYGRIDECWFDGAKGENAKDMRYDFKGFWALVRQLQPRAVMFSDAGPDVRWVGNEAGNAGETCWSTIDTTGISPGVADAKYLNIGDPNGKIWAPAETDVSIRKGWFYRPEEDSTVKSGKELVNLYYKSTGRNSLLLLNIPPDSRGMLSVIDVQSLKDFRAILDETFKINFAEKIVPAQLTDKNLSTYIKISSGKSLIVDFKKKKTMDRALFQENIAEGQRAELALLEYWNGKNWREIQKFTTIGYKRLLRFKEIETRKIRLTLLKAKAPVLLSEIGFYKSSPRE